MGGRGAASGISAQGFEYGDEFETILEADNIKFVKYLQSKAAQIPLETRSADKNRVYVLVNKDNILKSITFYNKDGKLSKQIDLAHKHQGQQPHLHIGYGHSKNIYPLTQIDWVYITKVRKIWNQR
jgi:hypothetical protein